MNIYQQLFRQEASALLLFEQGLLVDANPAALSLLQVDLGALKGQPFKTLFPDHDENTPTDIETITIGQRAFSVVVRFQPMDDGFALVSIRQPLLEHADLALSEQVADVMDFRDKLENLNEVSLQLASAPTLDELYKLAVKLGREKLGLDRMGILLVDLVNQEQYGTWGTSPEGDIKCEQDWRAPLENTPWIQEALEQSDYCHFWENIDLLHYGKVVGRGWSAMANLFDDTQLLGWIAADNLILRQPLTPTRQQIFRLYALTLSQLILRKRSELDLIEVNSTLEQKVEEKTQDLEERLNEVQAMQRQLIEQEKHASLGNLVAGVAHEINTPLGNSLMALSQLTYVAETLKRDVNLGKLTRSQLTSSTDEINESVSLLNSNLQRAVELVRSFKQLASDQSDTQVAHINLHDLIDNVFASFHNQYKNRPIECHNQVDSNLRFLGSPAIFTQIVTNLFDNGLRHAFVLEDGEAARKGKIGFSASLAGNQLTLTYRDNGCGIETDMLDRVFEPLQTSNRGKSKGLGLTIIDKLVREDLGGSLSCDNVEPSGVQFSLRCDVVVDESSVA